MAKDSAKGTQEERIFNIPLRREWLKVPRNERGKKAATTVRFFVSKHMKSYDVKISQKINEFIWLRGIQKPPHSLRVKVIKDSKGTVRVMLPEEKIQEPKKKEKKGRLEQVKETLEKEKGLPLGTGAREDILKKGKEKKSKDSGVKEETKETKEAKEAKEEKPTEAKSAEVKKETKEEVKKSEPKKDEKK